MSIFNLIIISVVPCEWLSLVSHVCVDNRHSSHNVIMQNSHRGRNQMPAGTDSTENGQTLIFISL